MLTIPTIGWVAKNNDNNTKSAAPPPGGAMPLPGTENDLSKIQGYDATENRRLTSVPSVARKKAPFTDKPDPEWPRCAGRMGGASNEKIRQQCLKDGRAFLCDGQ